MTQSPQVGSDAQEDQTGRFVIQPNGRPRPLSPHLQIWRYHVTMAASISHRISGVALTGGLILVILWLGALAFGPDAHAGFVALAGSPFGLFVWFGLSLMLFYHLFAGVRHLVWDTGAGLTPKTSSLLSWLSFAAAALATLIFWAALFTSGRVQL